jgi:plastocyanin
MVAAAPADAGGGGCHAPGASEGVGSTVETRGACFVPSVLRVEPGATVNFVNRDGIGHNLSGVNLGGFDELGPDAVVTHHFESVGTYPYACNLHPGMTGAIVVGDGRGGGAAVRVAAPVLAGADRPVTNDPGSDLSPVPFALGGVVAGLALSFVLRKGRAARA